MILDINLKPGRLLFPCVLLGSFKIFLADPCYEPLSWFMTSKQTYTVRKELYNLNFNGNPNLIITGLNFKENYKTSKHTNIL